MKKRKPKRQSKTEPRVYSQSDEQRSETERYTMRQKCGGGYRIIRKGGAK